jgi:hypothetical protein
MSTISELKTSITFGGGLARSNKFMVDLPSLGRGGIMGFLGKRNMNILCRSAQLPGKQILTHDRRLGMEQQKIAYGYAVDDVTLTFMETGTYPIRNYFDEWRELILNEDQHTVKYKNEYAKRVVIHQLGMPIPIGAIASRIPAIDVQASVYSVELVDAFPTTIGSVDFNNEMDGYVETTVQLSYKNWKRVPAGQLSFGFNF